MGFNQQLLDEFIENCRQGDLIKARLVLDHCNRIDLSSQKRILYELNKCDDAFALPLMLFISQRHETARNKFPMLSESIRERSKRSPSVFKELLQASTPDQTGYIKLIAEMKLREAAPWLIQMLTADSRPENQKTIIHALGEMEAESAVDTITEFLRSEDESVVVLAIDALGKIASADAITSLNQLLISRSAHIRNRAKSRMIDLGRRAAAVVTENLSEKNVDLLIHSLNILEVIRDQNSVFSIRRLINSNPKDANVRFAAYEALAQLPLRKGDYILAAGLTDSDSAIRLAAARAIDEHLDDSLLTGIDNMLSAEDSDSERTAKAIIDAQAGALAIQLLSNSFFRQFFIQRIAGSIDSKLKVYYSDLLRQAGHNSILEELETELKQAGTSAGKGRICAIDDSKMILKVYQSILNELSYESVLFEKPADFLVWIKNEKPDLVFTDLNMPNITGIDLVKAVRTQYDKEELPIVMATTQNEKNDLEKAYEAGVNKVIQKPFDFEIITSMLYSMGISKPKALS